MKITVATEVKSGEEHQALCLAAVYAAGGGEVTAGTPTGIKGEYAIFVSGSPNGDTYVIFTDDANGNKAFNRLSPEYDFTAQAV